MVSKKLFPVIALALTAMMLIAGCSSSNTNSKTEESKVETKGYPNSELIASEADLKKPGVVVLDARSAEAYDSGHIPASVSMPWGQFSDSGLNLLPVGEIESILGDLGISRESDIIIYDDTTASWGASGRLFWMFEYLGCRSVRILDGGWDKWVAEGNTQEIAPNLLPSTDFKASLKSSVVSGREHIENRLNDDDFVIIDTRSDAEFIGWKLYGEARGGHIRGAVHLPYEWYFKEDKTILDYEDMKELLESKGVTPHKEVSAYCTAGIRSAYAYFMLRLMGYENASNYDASIWDWAMADEDSHHMDKLENYEKLVHPGWVKQLIDGEVRPEGSDGFVIVETGWGTKGDTGYDKGHIPGAIHVNTDEIEYDDFYARNDPPEGKWFGRSTTEEEDAAKGLGPDDTLERNWWNLFPDEYLIPALAHMGITVDTTVVVYSRSPSAAGRIVWILMYAGVKDVRLFNGNLDTWRAAGFEVSTTDVERTPVEDFGATEPLRPELITDDAHIRAIANGEIDEDELIVDIRSFDEYTGKTAPYSYIPTSGRISGAVWGHSGDGLSGMNHFVDTRDNTMRSFKEIESMWADYGITMDKTVHHYCGTGWRAALTAFYAHLMGWENVTLFDSGWYKWSMGPESDINPFVDDFPYLP